MIFLYFILVLGILIFVHELGHFLVAKWLGIRGEKFSLGFGPKLIGWHWGDTEYLLSAFPLGGYVKLFGEGGFEENEMIEKDYELAGEQLPQRPATQLSDEDRAQSFSHRPISHRMAVVIAGPAFNMGFAWLLLIMLYLAGMPIMKATIGEVFKDKPAARAGLQTGDLITAVNGRAILQWEDFSAEMAKAKSEVAITIVRKEQTTTLRMTPELSDAKNLFGETIQKPIVGVSPAYDVVTQRFGLVDALQLGNAKAVEVTKLTVLSLVKLFQGVVPLKTVGGPIMIADMANKAASSGGATFFLLLAVVSINLGILNLLPVPVLDGGHLMFYTVELIIRRPVPQKVREYAQQAGMLLLIGLMMLAFYNDIMRYFFSS